MSNPLGHQDVVGNFVTCGDLFNKATTQGPAAVGSGLAATYVPGAVTFSSAATSNTYQCPYAEGLVVLVQLTSGTGQVALNTGSTTSNLQQVSLVTASSTSMVSMFYSMPSAALGTATPGAPTTPYFNLSVITSGLQIAQVAVFALGLLTVGEDWFSVRTGINAIASGVIGANDTLNPPTALIGSGAFTIASTIP